MSHEETDKGGQKHSSEWRKLQEEEHDPTVIVEDPMIEKDPLIQKIRTLIDSNEGGRLLSGRKN